MQSHFQATLTLPPQVLTCPSQILLPRRCTSQCLLVLEANTTTSPRQKPRIKITTVSTSRSTISKNTTNRNTTSIRNITTRHTTRVRKKTMTPPLLENLPLPETLPPLEMMMTAGRQARINLRFFGNLGKVQSGHSDKKYAMARARG